MRQIELEKLESLVEPVLAGLGYGCAGLDWKFESGWVLRVFLDKTEGAITHDDCTRASRALSAELDVADLVHGSYTLEVSSPGLNRPLRREADFRRFLGQQAKIRTRTPVGESRRNFRGRLTAVEGGRVRIEVEGQLYDIPVDDVERANLEYDFNGKQG